MPKIKELGCITFCINESFFFFSGSKTQILCLMNGSYVSLGLSFLMLSL